MSCELCRAARITPWYHEDEICWVAECEICAVPMVVLIPYLASSTASTAIGYVISAAGILYTLMYAIIAFACVWYYRQRLTASAGGFLITGALPLVGGVAMLAAFIYAMATQPPQVSLVTGTIILVAVIAAFVAWSVTKSPYFSDHRAAHDLAEEDRSPADIAADSITTPRES